ncbi:MAG TPA: hypothetical protein VLG74_07315 [Blastocatellia bacterium]|nr:hypothetical protein [Blastocatellia bacterium]
MSSVLRSTFAAQFDRAERLKNKLVRFATQGELQQEYELQRKLFFEAAEPDDEHEAESVLDWFLFDWFDEAGDGVIARYLDAEPALDEADREILLDWQDSINSVFEIRSVGKNVLEVVDLESGDSYMVRTRLEQTPFKRGQFIIARLLPLGDELIFSGLQFLMPDRESALAWLEMRRAFDAFDSPEAVEKAQREQVAAFCELFGCDELTVASNKLSPTLERFQRYLISERRDPETGMTAAERFRKELGQDLTVPDLPPLPEPVAGAGEVTILCDDFDGIVLLPDFTRFKRVFEIHEPDRQVPDWRDLVWTYIKNPDIPIVAFERVAEQFPLRVEKVLRTLIGDKDFSLEHLYAVLLHYKQPVDGLEDLKDDQHLWDLFNGNTPHPKSRKSVAKTPKRTAEPKPSKKMPRSAATQKRSAKKPAPTSRASGSRRKPAAKLKAPIKRAAPPAKKRTAKRTSAKKR